MTKQEFIKKEYGQFFEELKNIISENGWVSFYDDKSRIRKYFHENENIEISPNDNNNWRPKKLKGIDDNNGWVLIDGENSLPSLFCDLWVICDEKSKVLLYSSFEPDNHLCVGYVLMTYSHYQIVQKPKLPLFYEVL